MTRSPALRVLVLPTLIAAGYGGGCLPAASWVDASLNASVIVTGTEAGDVVILRAGARTATQVERDDDGTVTVRVTLPAGDHPADLALRRGDERLCSSFSVRVGASGWGATSLDVAELRPCFRSPFFAPGFVAITEGQERPPPCGEGGCLVTTMVRASGVVELTRDGQIEVGLLGAERLAEVLRAVTAEALDDVFQHGCPTSASEVRRVLVREWRPAGDPDVLLVEPVEVTGCDGDALSALTLALEGARAEVNAVPDGDGGALDGGTVDGGDSDAGALDAGPLDAGPLDAGPLDAGPLDAGPLDAGPLDAGPLDAGPLDAGPLDAGPLDAGPVSVCGDGALAIVGEDCDDGVLNSDAPGATCRLDCSLSRCGDGVVEPASGEACDDGNTDPLDGCSAECQVDPGFLCASSPSLCAPAAEVQTATACTDGECIRSAIEGAASDPSITLLVLPAGLWDLPTKIDVESAGSLRVVGQGMGVTVIRNVYTESGETLKLNHVGADIALYDLSLVRSNNSGNIVRVQRGRLLLERVVVGPSEGGNGLFVEADGELTARAVVVEDTGLGVNIKNGAVAVLDRCLLRGNAAGGALLDSDDVVRVTNTVFAENEGAEIGGVHLKRVPALFAFNTVVGNFSASEASGIRCDMAGTLIERSLIGANPSGVDDEVSDACTLSTSAFAPSEQSADDDPPVGACTVVDLEAGEYALPGGSPCRDALPVVEPLVEELRHDHRGAPRPNGAGLDVGAIEAP